MSKRFTPEQEAREAAAFFDRLEKSDSVLMREYETLVGMGNNQPVIILAIKGKVNNKDEHTESFFMLSPQDALEMATTIIEQVKRAANPAGQNWKKSR